jgi:hypothetical protein
MARSAPGLPGDPAVSTSVTPGVSTMMDPLAKAIDSGHRALLVSGNVHDLFVAGEEIVYRAQHLVDHLDGRGYVVIRYSKSQGGRIHNYSTLPPEAKKRIDSRLSAVGLLPLLNRELQNAPEEIRNFFRASARLLQIPAAPDDRPYAVVIEYTEHLAPAVHTSAAAADEQTFVAESLHVVANAPALRRSGNLLVCVVRDGFQNTLLNDLHRVEIALPDETQIAAFVRIALARAATYGRLAEGLATAEFSRLARGMRLKNVEAMLREARRDDRPLTRDDVLQAKATAILEASEGTLGIMRTELALDDIVGLDSVKQFARQVTEKLKAGDPTSPRAVLFVGPPGTSKSTFPPILAAMCGFNCLELRNVKNMYVGESERKLRLALSLIEHLAPTILFLDEITETTPSRTRTGDNSGVSQDLLAQLFKFSAREELRGRVLLIGACNVPERLDPAWHDRFTVVPFLELLPHDICQLLALLARRGGQAIDPTDPRVAETAEVLHRKGASPRKIVDIMNHALLWSDSRSPAPDDILAAAHDYSGAANPMAVAHASLIAISMTSYYRYLPWSADPKGYVHPWYLDGVVDKSSGVLDRDALGRRIQECSKHVNW